MFPILCWSVSKIFTQWHVVVSKHSPDMTGYLACCAQMRQNISLVEACADHHFDMVRAILTVTNPWPTFTSFSHSGQALCYVCKDGMLLLDVRRTWQIEWVYLGICPCEVLAKSVKTRFFVHLLSPVAALLWPGPTLEMEIQAINNEFTERRAER